MIGLRTGRGPRRLSKRLLEALVCFWFFSTWSLFGAAVLSDWAPLVALPAFVYIQKSCPVVYPVYLFSCACFHLRCFE